MKKPTREEAVAVTCVFWDMNLCPVPAGYDARVVRGCIKRLLEKNGYVGPLKVTAFGKLGDVPRDMLRGVYSSGIPLTNVPRGSEDFPDLTDFFNNPRPMNIMLISDREAPSFARTLRILNYNPLQPFPFHSLEGLILENSTGEFEEEETAGEPALWDCLVCARDPPGKDFESFTTHLDSEEHLELMATRKMATMDSVAPPLPAVHSDIVHVLPPYFDPLPTIETPSGYHVIDWEAVKSDYATYVFWDISSCPVPPGFDASLVGPCIRRFLKKEGCFGPLTIIASGLLTDIPVDMLSKLYSSGIILHNVPHGPSDTWNLIRDWSYREKRRCSIMVLSNAKIFTYFSNSLSKRLNLLQPFPNDSLQSICLADSGAFEEHECSEKGDSAFWVCSVCDYTNTPDGGFESFTMHTVGEYHREKMQLSKMFPPSASFRILSTPLSEPTELNLEGVTSVFWDMKTCPVPPGFDPCLVGPCIKRYLENKGYSGPLTITAAGELTDVPFDMLRGVYSSGITLINDYGTGFTASRDLIFEFRLENPPPANIVAICDANLLDSLPVSHLQMGGYNLLPFDSLESFLLADSGPIEEDKCSDSALWICEVCSKEGKGFENFTNHVTSRRHERELLDCLPANARFLRGENTPNHGDKGKL